MPNNIYLSSWDIRPQIKFDDKGARTDVLDPEKCAVTVCMNGTLDSIIDAANFIASLNEFIRGHNSEATNDE